jgi:hypothetical protein
MALSVGVKERRHCDLDARMGTSVLVRIGRSRSWDGVCHHIWRMA